MTFAYLDERGRPFCGAHDHTDPVTSQKRFPLADVDSDDPSRCFCRECGTAYFTPPEVVYRILWHVFRASVRPTHASVREAIAVVVEGS